MSYINIWIHLIWSTKNRKPILQQEMRHRVFTHIRGNAKAKGIYLDFINGYVEHIHLLISLKADQSLQR